MIISENGFGQEGDGCLVCGIPLDRQAIVEYQYQGERMVLCSNDCLKEFLENPEKYREDKEEEAEAEND